MKKEEKKKEREERGGGREGKLASGLSTIIHENSFDKLRTCRTDLRFDPFLHTKAIASANILSVGWLLIGSLMGARLGCGLMQLL